MRVAREGAEALHAELAVSDEAVLARIVRLARHDELAARRAKVEAAADLVDLLVLEAEDDEQVAQLPLKVGRRRARRALGQAGKVLDEEVLLGTS